MINFVANFFYYNFFELVFYLTIYNLQIWYHLCELVIRSNIFFYIGVFLRLLLHEDHICKFLYLTELLKCVPCYCKILVNETRKQASVTFEDKKQYCGKWWIFDFQFEKHISSLWFSWTYVDIAYIVQVLPSRYANRHFCSSNGIKSFAAAINAWNKIMVYKINSISMTRRANDSFWVCSHRSLFSCDLF